jgi:hypothetical protein
MGSGIKRRKTGRGHRLPDTPAFFVGKVQFDFFRKLGIVTAEHFAGAIE